MQVIQPIDESLEQVKRERESRTNLGLDIVDGIRRLHLKGDSLAGEGLDKDLHTTTKAKDKVKSGFFLNVVVRQGATVLKLLSGENETLLVGRNPFLVLDL